MVSNLDLQKWQQAINGINESGQQDLTGEEWSALIALNNSLQTDNFESDESRNAHTLLKGNLMRHKNNRILYVHLLNFIALYEQYCGITNIEKTNSKTDKEKGSGNKNLIFIAVALIIGYLVFSNWNGGIGGNGDSLNGQYENVDKNWYNAAIPDIIEISGDNLIQKWSFLGAEYTKTIKFRYEDGKITITEDDTSFSIPCEFKNGSLWLYEMEYKKVK